MRKYWYFLAIFCLLIILSIDYSCAKSTYDAKYKDQFSPETQNIYPNPIDGENDYFGGLRPLGDLNGEGTENELLNISLISIENITTQPQIVTFNCNAVTKKTLLARIGLSGNLQPNSSDPDTFTTGVIVYGGTDANLFPVQGIGIDGGDEFSPYLFCFKTELQYLVVRGSSINNDTFTKQADLLRSLTDLDRLDLEGAALKEFPTLINNFYSLKNLNLSGNEADEKMKLENMSALNVGLEKLSINNAQVHFLSGMNCSNLKILYAHKNSLYNDNGLEQFFSECRKLQELDLSGNSLEASQITNLSNNLSSQLKKLDLSNNNIKNEFFTLSNFLSELNWLNLNNTGLTSFPDFVVNYTKLEDLDLSGNSFTKNPISSDIKNLTKLKNLYLQGTGIKSIPEELCKDDKLRIYLSPDELKDVINSNLFWSSPASQQCSGIFKTN
jgi:Leucine-rich repeat (LRR) protein